MERLAQIAGMSRAAFAERFARQIGQTPFAYLTALRMHIASSRLSAGKPVKAVAYGLGYASEKAFAAAFRRLIGHPPSALKPRRRRRAL